ncbi:endonuclease [Mycobacteroides sp. LB1]|uniref:endonuclease n=1 Tax=Mycobacteroides sp. LB1 TaxID=2750814 RepID=UPI002103230F
MSFSLADLKRAKVASFRDVADALDGMATANRDMQRGVAALPIMGDAWKGVSGDAAHHELDGHGKYLGGAADAQHGAAARVRRAADEFEGVQQLLKKVENDAASGKFTIDLETGKVTPPKGEYDKSELDYLTNTLKQLRAAGETANTDLEAAVKAAKELPESSNAGGALPSVPAAKDPSGIAARLKGLDAPNPDGDPGATKAAAAGADTQANYKDWYPKTAVPGGDKPIDPRQLGGLAAVPGVGDVRDKIPQPLQRPVLRPEQVEQFKTEQRQILTKMGVPADQIEQRVNAAAENAQTPHFKPDAPSASPTDPKYISRDFGEQFNKFTNNISDGGSKAGDAMLQQGKELTGQAGPGAPGVAEKWKDLAVNTGKGLWDYTTATPQERVGWLSDEAQRAADNPGGYIGEKLVQTAAGAATAPIGGEAFAGARALLGDLPHHLPEPHIPGAAHAPTEPPSGAPHPAPVVDHPAPSPSVEHSGGWNHSTEQYSPQAPQLASDLNNAFVGGHPTADLAGQVADHATHHAPGMGSAANPDRVVLGKWAGDDAGYIGEARHNGGIYYDTGGDAWNAIGNGLSRTDADALGWQVNEQFLKTQMQNGIPRIDYVVEGSKFSSIQDVLRTDPNSFSAKEIKYLMQNAPAYGYERIGDSWVREGGR